MGYACPVCDQPQADAGHLANHLAFTALTGGTDHEAWLDEHVPDWGQMGEADLAPVVVDHASETEYPQVFEDTTDQGTGHSHDHETPTGAGRGREQRSLSAADREVLSEARELTEAMLDDETESNDDAQAEDETQ
jgi:hypothetical protein